MDLPPVPLPAVKSPPCLQQAHTASALRKSKVPTRVATGHAGQFASHRKSYLAHELRDDTCAPSMISSLHSQGSWQELGCTSTSKNSRWNLLPLKPKPFSPAYRQRQKLQLHTCRHNIVLRMNQRTCSKRSEVLGSLWHILACRPQKLSCTWAVWIIGVPQCSAASQPRSSQCSDPSVLVSQKPTGAC